MRGFLILGGCVLTVIWFVVVITNVPWQDRSSAGGWVILALLPGSGLYLVSVLPALWIAIRGDDKYLSTAGVLMLFWVVATTLYYGAMFMRTGVVGF